MPTTNKVGFVKPTYLLELSPQKVLFGNFESYLNIVEKYLKFIFDFSTKLLIYFS